MSGSNPDDLPRSEVLTGLTEVLLHRHGGVCRARTRPHPRAHHGQLAATRTAGRVGGCPSKLDADKLAAAQARRARGESLPQIARAWVAVGVDQFLERIVRQPGFPLCVNLSKRYVRAAGGFRKGFREGPGVGTGHIRRHCEYVRSCNGRAGPESEQDSVLSAGASLCCAGGGSAGDADGEGDDDLCTRDDGAEGDRG